MAARFYVYRLFDDPLITLYVGKGSGNRLRHQKHMRQCGGEVLRWFDLESEAYAYEKKMIAEMVPDLNKHPGGNGAKAARQYRPKWLVEIEKIGTGAYAARVLLRYFYLFDQSKINALSGVAYGSPH